MEYQRPFADFPASFSQRFPELKAQKVLISLSGGADSVALLHLLFQCEVTLEAAYVDHGTRPREVKQEIARCRSMCEGLGISFHILQIEKTVESSGSREADWRQQRYQSLSDLAEKQGIRVIATAHHRDDVAEGVLLQLLRGGGPRAMAGIKERTETNIIGPLLIRPLLAFSHGDLVSWLQEQGITWCNDSSNDDTSHLRNHVRHTILPLLEKTAPGLRGHLIHLAGTLASDERFIRDELKKRAVWIDPWSPSGGVDREAVRHLSPALRSRWLHAQAQHIGLERVSRQQIALFNQMIETSTPRSVNLNRRWRLRLVAGILWLEPPIAPTPFEYELIPSEEIALPIPGWNVALRHEFDPPIQGALAQQVSAGTRIVIRSCQKGECIIEKGRPKRVSTLLARKLPRHLRNAWPLLVVDDTICWIPGVWQGLAIRARQTQRVEVFRK